MRYGACLALPLATREACILLSRATAPPMALGGTVGVICSPLAEIHTSAPYGPIRGLTKASL